MADLQERLARVRELLATERHAAVATVNADGSPHNTPLFVVFDDELNGFWVSSAQAAHSQNVARTGRAFVTLFSSSGAGGGLYIDANVEVLEGEALDVGLKTFNARLQTLGRPAIPTAQLSGDASQRLYVARPNKMWVNMSTKDPAGRVLGDERHEITAEDLR